MTSVYTVCLCLDKFYYHVLMALLRQEQYDVRNTRRLKGVCSFHDRLTIIGQSILVHWLIMPQQPIRKYINYHFISAEKRSTGANNPMFRYFTLKQRHSVKSCWFQYLGYRLLFRQNKIIDDINQYWCHDIVFLSATVVFNKHSVLKKFVFCGHTISI